MGNSNKKTMGGLDGALVPLQSLPESAFMIQNGGVDN